MLPHRIAFAAFALICWALCALALAGSYGAFQAGCKYAGECVGKHCPDIDVTSEYVMYAFSIAAIGGALLCFALSMFMIRCLFEGKKFDP
jgi:hypothetical protein